MGPPGFEPESQAPKAQRIDQATLRSQQYATYNNYIFILYKVNEQYIKNMKIKPRAGIEPATTRLQVWRSTRLSHRGNENYEYNII